jgi:hypothetical protein
VHSLTLRADSKVTGGTVIVSRDPDANTTRVEQPESKRHVTIAVLLPDKFLETSSGRASSFRGVNGNAAIVNRKTLPRQIPTDPRLMDLLTAQQHRHFMLDMIALLLMPPEHYGVRFAGGGEANTESGLADVVDVNGPYNLAARLFFDKESGRLQMLAFEEPPRSGPAAPPGDQAKAGSREAADAGRAAGQAASTLPENQPLFKSLQGPAAPPLVMDRNVRIRCADYRLVDGILLPYRITTEFGGGTDEWRVSKYEVNPPLKPQRFEKR